MLAEYANRRADPPTLTLLTVLPALRNHLLSPAQQHRRHRDRPVRTQYAGHRPRIWRRRRGHAEDDRHHHLRLRHRSTGLRPSLRLERPPFEHPRWTHAVLPGKLGRDAGAF